MKTTTTTTTNNNPTAMPHHFLGGFDLCVVLNSVGIDEPAPCCVSRKRPKIENQFVDNKKRKPTLVFFFAREKGIKDLVAIDVDGRADEDVGEGGQPCGEEPVRASRRRIGRRFGRRQRRRLFGFVGLASTTAQ